VWEIATAEPNRSLPESDEELEIVDDAENTDPVKADPTGTQAKGEEVALVPLPVTFVYW
jgi:hypothetical protein